MLTQQITLTNRSSLVIFVSIFGGVSPLYFHGSLINMNSVLRVEIIACINYTVYHA